MTQYLHFETLPDHDLYTDAYATFDRMLERDNGVLDDVLDRLTSVQLKSQYTARKKIAAYTINLGMAEPSQSDLVRHRSFVAGFSQSVSIGKMLFKSNQYTELTMADSMESLLAQAYEVCESSHPAALEERESVRHYSHAIAHLAEAGEETLGHNASTTIRSWAERAFPGSQADRTAYVVGHFVAGLTVHRHQNFINKLVRPSEAESEDE